MIICVLLLTQFYYIPFMKFSVSIVIPNYNGQQLLADTIKSALAALASSEISDFEIIVSDDASTDDSVNIITRDFPDVILVKSDVNTGFAGNMNRGIKRASKDLVCFLNSDVHLTSTYFASQLSLFENEQAFGVMGAIYDQETNEAQDGAKNPRIRFLRIESNRNTFSSTELLPTMFLSGANALVRREYLLQLGGFCELYNPYYSEDVDLGLQAWRHGWKLYFQPLAMCHHAQSSTIKKLPNQLVRMIAKRNKHFLHFLHLPPALNWMYLLSVFFKALGQLLIGKTLHITAVFSVFKNLKKLQKERKQRREKAKDKPTLSIFQVKQVIVNMTQIKS